MTDKKKTQDSQESKKQPSSPKKEAKVKSLNGSVDKDYQVPQGEEGLVHYELTDYASPRPRDLNKEYKPVKRIVKVSPFDFVKQYASNYTDNEMFTNVTTPAKIVRIQNNITKKDVEEAYAEQIQSATQGRPKAKAQMVSRLFESAQKLNMSGSNQVIEKGGVKHIPTNDNRYPFDPKELGSFPDDVKFDGEE